MRGWDRFTGPSMNWSLSIESERLPISTWLNLAGTAATEPMSGTMPGSNSMQGSRREDLALHPTVKPTGLVADAIQDVTRRGDLVLDFFLGSGTTLIGRRADRTALPRTRSSIRPMSTWRLSAGRRGPASNRDLRSRAYRE